jgi:hypothetical protein
VLPFWNGKAELLQHCRDRKLDVNANMNMGPLEEALRRFCKNALTVRGSTTSANHIDNATDENIYRDAKRCGDL